MKRQDKYPDTSTFHYFNANPKSKITDDCVIRAICLALGQGYCETLYGILDTMNQTGYMIDDKKCYSRYLKLKGYEIQNQLKKDDNTKYIGEEFCRYLNDRTYFKGKKIIAHIGGHHIVCIMEHEGQFKVHDTWDSTDGCIGNYWVID